MPPGWRFDIPTRLTALFVAYNVVQQRPGERPFFERSRVTLP